MDSENNSQSASQNEVEVRRETYPIKTFASVEAFLGNVYKKYGDTDILSLAKIADANNLSEKSIKQTVSTCQQYGCLKNIHGKGYLITEDFTRIYHPENDDEKLQTTIDCIKNVPFYKPLFADYIDKVVPALDGLKNRFIRNYGMKEHLAKGAAEIFLQNLRDYNLLNARGVLILKTQPTLNEPTANTSGNAVSDQHTVVKDKPKKEVSKDLTAYEFPLTGDKKAILYYPKDNMENEDFEIMVMALELIARTKRLNIKINTTEKTNGAM